MHINEGIEATVLGLELSFYPVIYNFVTHILQILVSAVSNQAFLQKKVFCPYLSYNE
jgi:hypothetical protein